MCVTLYRKKKMAIRGFFTLDYLNLLHDLLSEVAWVTSGADLHPSVDGQM